MLISKNTPYGKMSYYENDMDFARGLRQNKIYEQEYVLNHLKEYIIKSNVILDIGAHAGSHTVLYKHINPDVTIYCFEPQKKMFEVLTKNIKDNNFKNVFPYNFAVANKNIKTNMNNTVLSYESQNDSVEYGGGKIRNLGGLQVGEGGEDIETITIDSLNIEKVDFIKIDVEGFEPAVLIGAKNTIIKNKPVISFESNEAKMSQKSAEEFDLEYPVKDSFSILKDYGYKDIKLVDNLWNYVATY